MSRPMLPLLLLGACTMDGVGLYADPPDPVWASVHATCDADQLTVVALLDGELPTSNVTLQPTEDDGYERDVVYPVNDLTQADGRITRWTTTLDHDCDDPLVLTWSAYTTMGTEAHTATRYPLAPPEIEGLTPPYGSTAGGDEVRLTGPWLSEVTDVTVGGAAASVLAVDDAGLLLETPAGTAGPVDVVITGEGGETTLPAAYTYYEDQTGMVRGIGNFTLAFNVDALVGYDSAYGSVDGPFAQFELLMHEPQAVADHWWTRWPAPGECGVSEFGGVEAVSVGNYVDVVDADGDLGAFAMVTRGEGSTYYMLAGDVTEAAWAGARFDVSWPDDLADLPAMSVPGGIWTAPVPDALNLDYTVANALQRGTDLPITFVPEDDLHMVMVTPYVTRSNASVLGTFSCMEDTSGGDVSIPWDVLMAGVDTTQATQVYLRLDFVREQQIELPHDHSVLWAMGINTMWFRIEMVD